MIIISKYANKVDLEEKIEILTKIKQEIKESPIAIEIAKEHGKPDDFLEGIPIEFSDDIDVSAKTVNSKIMINESLLEKPFNVIMRYVIHELVHAFQHMERDGAHEDPYADDDYLDREDEQEAFSKQIEFQQKSEGPAATQEYVENLDAIGLLLQL